MSARKKLIIFVLTGWLISAGLAPAINVSAIEEQASPSSTKAEEELNLESLITALESTDSAEIPATSSADPDLSLEPTVEVMPSPTLGVTPKEKRKRPILKKNNLQAKEKMEIELGDYQLSDLQINLVDKDGKEITVEKNLEEGRLKISPPRQFFPGKYHLTITSEQETLLEQDFTWGVLAINVNKSVYLPGETAKLAMAVLDEQGKMVCDAKLTLKITNPQGETEELSTEKETIKVNPECQLHSYTEKPDYETSYQTKGVGAYQMELLAKTKNGEFTLNDSFEVREQVAFDIERSGPTRIYPPATYAVGFNISASEDFEGVVEETVPSSFEILPLENEEEVLGKTTLAEVVAEVENNTLTSYQRSYDKVEEQKKTKVISWYVSVKNGEKINLGYRFDAPDISPQFYLLGPLKFLNTGGQSVFQETRQWQIAADATACSSTATGGNWGTSTTWNSPCNVAGGPTVANDVTITAGATVTVEASTTRAAYSVTFTTGTNLNSILALSSSGGAVLNVSTSVTIPYARTSGYSVSLYVDQNTLTAGSITIGSGTRDPKCSVEDFNRHRYRLREHFF